MEEAIIVEVNYEQPFYHVAHKLFTLEKTRAKKQLVKGSTSMTPFTQYSTPRIAIDHHLYLTNFGARSQKIVHHNSTNDAYYLPYCIKRC